MHIHLLLGAVDRPMVQHGQAVPEAQTVLIRLRHVIGPLRREQIRLVQGRDVAVRVQLRLLEPGHIQAILERLDLRSVPAVRQQPLAVLVQVPAVRRAPLPDLALALDQGLDDRPVPQLMGRGLPVLLLIRDLRPQPLARLRVERQEGILPRAVPREQVHRHGLVRDLLQEHHRGVVVRVDDLHDLLVGELAGPIADEGLARVLQLRRSLAAVRVRRRGRLVGGEQYGLLPRGQIQPPERLHVGVIERVAVRVPGVEERRDLALLRIHEPFDALVGRIGPDAARGRLAHADVGDI